MHRKKVRKEEGFFLVEGEKIVKELSERHPEVIDCICTTDSNLNLHANIFSVDGKEMKQISTLQNPSKLVAVVKQKKWIEPTSKSVLVIDELQDPGNLGTIIRTADWFGFDRIICSMNTVDCYNSKVIQSAMGSLFSVQIEYHELANYLDACELPIYAAMLDGEPISKESLGGPCALLVGNEGQGIRSELLPFIDHRIKIEGKGKAESLNVAIATGILLSQMSH